jgi:hypothetical protein
MKRYLPKAGEVAHIVLYGSLFAGFYDLYVTMAGIVAVITFFTLLMIEED